MFKFFKSKTPKNSSAPEFIIAGLGNPERKYEYTRHNAGFLCLDVLCNKYNFRIDRLKFHSLICDTVIEGHRCIVMKPQTFMNSSGDAIKEVADFYKIPPEKIIVIFDDMNFPCGKLRIRTKGSHGGHNGIKSIITRLGSSDFPRIKLGIGSSDFDNEDLIGFVLSNFTKAELDELKKSCENACNALPYILNGNFEKAMNLYNS